MAHPERIDRVDSPRPTFEVDMSPLGVKLEVAGGKKIPHADLIQATMNASAIVLFDLRPCFSTEGGIEGIYQGDPIKLTNWDDGHLGILNEFWQDEDEGEGLWEVLGFYEVFLHMMFKMNLKIEDEWYPPETFLAAPSLQTAEAVWARLDDIMRNLGSGALPPKVKHFFTNNELARRYLRGLTDEEVKQIFVKPPDLT